MAFDQSTRNRLQRFVTDARRTLEEEFTRQLQNDYGLDPISGTASPLESLRHINDQQRETARILRDTLAHKRSSCAGGPAAFMLHVSCVRGLPLSPAHRAASSRRDTGMHAPLKAATRTTPLCWLLLVLQL